MNNKILTVNNLSKSFYTTNSEIKTVDKISFSVNKNDILAIVGTSGCGKSTLLNIISGLDKEYEGNINIKNYLTGYMFQTDSLFEWLTIYENAILGLKINHITDPKLYENVDKLLKQYKLYEFKDKKPNSLSGGMRQRVALIRTLSINPEIILLDEAFSALDYQTRIAISNDLYNTVKENNKTVIMVTHDISEAISMANKIIILSKRPCKIKKTININFDDASNPIERRKSKKFSYYYDLVWKELDINV